MKMSVDLFKELESDCMTIVKNHRAKGYTLPFERKNMWLIFNTIMFDRMNDDSHPAFTQGVRQRQLPFWGRNGEKTRDEQTCNDHWLNRFYKDEDLNDSHITTALNRIHARIVAENI